MLILDIILIFLLFKFNFLILPWLLLPLLRLQISSSHHFSEGVLRSAIIWMPSTTKVIVFLVWLKQSHRTLSGINCIALYKRIVFLWSDTTLVYIGPSHCFPLAMNRWALSLILNLGYSDMAVNMAGLASLWKAYSFPLGINPMLGFHDPNTKIKRQPREEELILVNYTSILKN